MRGVAGQGQARRAQHDEAAPPAVHAGLGQIRVVVGRDEQDLHLPPQPAAAPPRPPRARGRAGRARAGARRGSAAPSRDTARSPAPDGRRRAARRARPPLRTRSRFSRWSTVLRVRGKPSSFTQPATTSLRSKERRPAIRSEGAGLGVLYGDLDIVEPERAEAGQPLPAQGHAARDQVGVEVEPPRLPDEGLEIIADQRLAAGQVELDDAEVLGLAEHAEPGRGVELLSLPGVVERIGAVHAAQRTAIRQLGDQRVRALASAHPEACTRPRSAMVWRKPSTSRSTAGASWPY